MKAYERFLKYVSINTRSDHQSDSHPSTKEQFQLADFLAKELEALGVQDMTVSDTCYVYGKIPASKGYEDKPALGFIAHMDTAPDASGEHVKPQIVHSYDGKDVLLAGSGDILSTKMFPHLNKLRGRTLITTDGTTLLGADDKAGAAEIMTACEILIKENIPHGPICIGFTPDEEIGQGVDFFDVDLFGADIAYTVDGGEEGEIEYENFNASSAVFEIKGTNVHPGDAKDTMINASLLAMEINQMLPADQIPARTEGYEGFYHLIDMEGNVNHAKLSYIIRDHDDQQYENKKELLRQILQLMNQKYGEGTVTLMIEESYQNMVKQIEPCFHLIENARIAIKKAGLVPITNPIRGGTDGARLSYMGLPCPNLGTGGYAYHGKYEHITVEGMEISTNIILEIIKLYADFK